MEQEKCQEKVEVSMKKRNNYFKVGYWIFVCAILLTGCSKEHSTEERIVVEDVKEEIGEEKIGQQEMESDNVPLEKNTKDMEEYLREREIQFICIDDIFCAAASI